MWILTDEAGEHAYTQDGRFAPLPRTKGDGVALFDTWDEAERVQFVLRWALQCFVEPKEVM
jgi:hypothetical protein